MIFIYYLDTPTSPYTISYNNNNIRIYINCKFTIKNDFLLYPKKISEIIKYFNKTKKSIKKMTQFKIKIQNYKKIINTNIINITKFLNLGKL